MTLSPLSTACFQRVLLALLTLLLPLQLASAAMTARAAGVEVPADFGEEIHTGEEATARVLSVRAAGPVEQGAGHVVTGRSRPGTRTCGNCGWRAWRHRCG